MTDKVFAERDKFRNIILLEPNDNKRGDLFTRLSYDVFHALGFCNPQFDVQKSGREIDIILTHRTENRYAVAECKSIQDKVGGSDINKFVGALDLEAELLGQGNGKVVGYFVSRTGFSETAIQQEKERAQARKANGNKSELVLLGPERIASELINGKMLCTIEKAIQTVKADGGLLLCEKADLIASEFGWIWVLYYSPHPEQTATHFAFVHADGNRLLNDLAEKLIEQAKIKKCAFSELEYIKAPADPSSEKLAAQRAYYNYLENELGEIQFEGMPTDKEAGAVKVNLESIFTPLHFLHETSVQEDGDGEKTLKAYEHVKIEKILNQRVRAAILAKPGGGKSTLIRRIALAYAFPERRLRVDDGLPDRDLFPVYIRCRDLGNDATKCINEIIGSIVNRAEITRYSYGFKLLTEDALQAGRVLLLIDGLDEISNEKFRIAFVNQLRTFVATYPTVNLIVTSREAGFRAVAGTLSGYCEQYTIAALNHKEIHGLCLKWHEAILGKSAKTQEEADKVYAVIIQDSRIVALAENPLLLTTLLFVKRWVGYLPTKKCHLYAEMIKLLMVTWNAVAHEKLDIDETRPQLAFVAYHMTIEGQQKITRDKLEKYIISARKELPDILSYTDISPSNFIDQVEERSSLLIQYGLDEDENGQLVPSYEFSHLSFQEYLTALAITKSWIPDADRSLLEILKPHLTEEHWKEVIPLVAVLSGRQAKSLIEYLINLADKDVPSDEYHYTLDIRTTLSDYAATHLANCIASEVPMSEETLEHAVKIVIKRKSIIARINSQKKYLSRHNIFNTILKSKYGNTYREAVKNMLFGYADDKNMYSFADAWIDICVAENKNSHNIKHIHKLFKSGNPEDKISGALLMMQRTFSTQTGTGSDIKNSVMTYEICEEISAMLDLSDPTAIYASSWCLAWMGYENANILPEALVFDTINKLIRIRLKDGIPNKLKRTTSWAIYSCVTPKFKESELKNFEGLQTAVEDMFANPQNDFDQKAALHLAFIYGIWDKTEIISRLEHRSADEVKNSGIIDSTLLAHFGIETVQKFKTSHIRIKSD